jgi:hypothetical protein
MKRATGDGTPCLVCCAVERRRATDLTVAQAMAAAIVAGIDGVQNATCRKHLAAFTLALGACLQTSAL